MTSFPVYYCPKNERSNKAVAITRFFLRNDDTFDQLLKNSAHFFGADVKNSFLKDEFGSLWPLQHPVIKELKTRASADAVIRLVHEVEDQSVAEEVPVAPPEEGIEEDDLQLNLGKPVRLELLSYVCFVLLLLMDTFVVRRTDFVSSSLEHRQPEI